MSLKIRRFREGCLLGVALFLWAIPIHANKVGYFPRDSDSGSAAPYYDHSAQQALAAFRAKDYPTALRLFKDVIRFDPRDASAYYYLARCQAETGDLKEAVLNFYISDLLEKNAISKAAGDRVAASLTRKDKKWFKDHLSVFEKNMDPTK